MTRDPRDVAVSNFYHKSGVGIYKGEKKEHLQLLLNDDYNYCSYWDHVLEFWSIRHHENILFLTYEQMKTDMTKVVKRVSSFLHKKVSPKQMSLLLDHLSFEKMSVNKSCNHEHEVENTQRILDHTDDSFKFMKKGVTQSFKEEMDKEMLMAFDEWIYLNLKPLNLTLDSLLQ